jgi:uncharacterized damage-inducible protein DinB
LVTSSSSQRKFSEMPFSKRALQLDIGYTAWANQRMLAAAAALSSEDLTRDLKNSHHSILGTLRHIYDGERFWTERLIANSLPPMRTIGRPDPPPDLPPNAEFAAMQRDWPIVSSDLVEWFAPLSADDLAATIPCEMPNGSVRNFPRWQLLRHLVNHSTLHRGQVIGMVRSLGIQPPNVDLLSYYMSQEA